MMYKFAGYIILLGLILGGIGTFLHPLTVNPWDGSTELHKASKEEHWMLDHSIMVIAIFLWLMGLLIATKLLAKTKALITVASVLFGVALSIWLIVLGMELTIFPSIFKHLTDKTHAIIGSLFFCYGLFAGYIAMVLIWIGTGCLSYSSKFDSKWFKRYGVIASFIGVIGTIITIVVPNTLLLGAITAFPTFWVIFLAIKLIKIKNAGGTNEGKYT